VPTPQVLNKAYTNQGTSSVFWSPAGEHMPHCKGSCPSKQERRFQFTTDFSSLMQEVVSLPDWKQGNAMALIIDGHSDFDDTPSLRSYESFDGTSTGGYSWTSRSPTHGPTIYVAWCLPPPPAGQVTNITTNTDSAISSETTSGDAALIGGVVGGIAAVVILLLVSFMCFMRQREKQGKPIFKMVEADAQPSATQMTAQKDVEKA
jgi:hypothetical protein